MNFCSNYAIKDYEIPITRKRAVSERLAFFIFMYIHHGSNEVDIRFCAGSSLEGILFWTISNYLEHEQWSLYASLNENVHALIKWPTAEKRHTMGDLANEFSKTLAFVKNIMLVTVWTCGAEQENKSDGNHESQWIVVRLWTAIFGVITRYDINVLFSAHNRSTFNDSRRCDYPMDFFEIDQLFLVDEVFTDLSIHIRFPFKRNQKRN